MQAKAMQPMVLCQKWPEDVQMNAISSDNLYDTITNSDLRTAGQLLGWLVTT